MAAPQLESSLVLFSQRFFVSHLFTSHVQVRWRTFGLATAVPGILAKGETRKYCDRLRGHSRNNYINLTKVIFIHNNHMYVTARTVNAIEC